MMGLRSDAQLAINPQGFIEYDHDKYVNRFAAKFSKPICRECRIAPLCGGGCRQRCVETLTFDGCNFGYTEEDMDYRIISILEYMMSISENFQQS